MKGFAFIAALALGCGSPPYSHARDVPTSVLARGDEIVNASLSADVAVRHRRAPIHWADISLAGRFAGSAPPPVASVMTSPVAATDKLVVELWLELRVDDVAAAANAVSARVVADGGRVVSSNLIGAGTATSSAALELRVPPGKTGELSSWLGGLGVVESQRSLESDVAKTMVDQQLERDNLEIAMKRLQALAARDVPIGELLEIEKEMTRVRGELERVEGEQRFLADRVELATVTLTIRHDGAPIELAHARIYPGVRVTSLSLLDPGTRPQTRIGGGISVRVERYLTFDLDVFPSSGGDSRAVIATIGGALYSGYLGFGNRRFGNPYLGARIGGGYLSGTSAFVLGGELGVELYKQRLVVVEAALRAVAFLRHDDNEAALEGVLGLSIPF